MYKNTDEMIAHISTLTASKSKDYVKFKEVVNDLNNPQLKLKNCIHVAGTNGKGSTVNYIRSVLQAHGFKVGTFVSPHLVSHHDRIKINDIAISDDDLLKYGNKIYPLIEKNQLTMFEIDMLMSIYYFMDEQVDFVIYEVGIGGRLDATNIISPIVSVITNIGKDHMHLLGYSLEEIAFEKAGIVKEGIPLFTMEDKQECLDVFLKVVDNHNAQHFQGNTVENIKVEDGLVFDYKSFKEIQLNSMAVYQTKNAALAMDVLCYLDEVNKMDLSESIMREALKSAMWRGRFEVIEKSSTIILDGAHNEHGVNALCLSLSYLPKIECIIFAALKDKEYGKMLEKLKMYANEVIVTEFDFYRSCKAVELSKMVEGVLVIASYREAIEYALEKYKHKNILITGSLYFISEARQYLNERS